MSKKLLLILPMLAVLPSCPQTVADIRDNPSGYKQPATTTSSAPSAPLSRQQKEALELSQLDEVNRDFRELNGRVELVENQLNQLHESAANKSLENTVAQLTAKIALLETTVAELNSRAKTAAANSASSDAREAAKKAAPLGEANNHFENKKWEDAILAYEEYRKAHPKGDHYPEATYKIGVSFQSLGLKDDARAFFKEVVDKYPKSREANLAKTQLKKL